VISLYYSLSDNTAYAYIFDLMNESNEFPSSFS